MEWISVKDRLPKLNEDVVCIVPLMKKHGKEKRILYLNCYQKNGLRWGNYDGHYEHNVNEVTHWMPLPEPPKD
jgi:hypothetical protein